MKEHGQSMNKKAVIIGYGFVGKATEKYLKKFNDIDLWIHDPDLGMIASTEKEYDFCFICVPTNLIQNRELDIDIVLDVYNEFKGEQIIRSTIGPDQIGLFHDDVVLWPEFLREVTWEDQLTQPEVDNVIGDTSGSSFTEWLANHTFGNIEIVTQKEASMFKMSRNAFLAMKVTFANLLNIKCNAYNIDYNNVKALLKYNIDPTTHLDTPGPDGKAGFGGKCLPKDTTHFMNLFGVDKIFESILDFNNKIRK